MTDLSTVVAHLKFFSEHCPDRELFIFYNGTSRKSFTARELWVLSGRFASRLHQHGFKKNDVIVNNLPNSPERLVTDVGIMMAGCTPMNCQILLSDGSDFTRSAKVSRCRGIVMAVAESNSAWRVFKPYVKEIYPGQFADMDCSSIGLPELTTAVLVTRTEIGVTTPLMDDLTSDTQTEPYVGQVEPDDVLYVYSTSGSTGYSKLVPRTHRELIELFAKYWGKCDWETIFSTKPLAGYNDKPLGWSGGYPYYTYIKADVRVLLDLFTNQEELRSGQIIWNAITSEQVEIASMLSSDLVTVSEYVKSLSEPSNYKIKMLPVGGQPVSKTLQEAGLSISQTLMLGYALTEAGFVSRSNVKEPQKDFFCGKVVKGMELKILDSDTGEPCGPGVLGDIYIRGEEHMVFTGYFNRLEAIDPQTKSSFTEDGWLITNDVGYLDEEDNFYVLGRTKDMITHDGYGVYPSWLEAEIEKHPKIKDTCVVPVSDPIICQKICACVEGNDITVEEVTEYCQAMLDVSSNSRVKPMPEFFLILNEFPKTTSGKVDRKKLTAMAEKKFGVVDK